MTTEAPKVNFYGLPLNELQMHLMGLGKEKFRAKQLYKWVYEKGVTNFEDMTDISKEFRRQLPNLFDLSLPKVVERLDSRDGTIKLLVDVGEAEGMDRTVEAVLIPSDGRMTLCVSSEVGCNLGCKFCYTGKTKLKKRLSAAQIVGQFLRAREALPEGQSITNMVFMGMGEPLDNPEGVFKSIRVLLDENGINFSRRKITVSTSGLVPMIPEVTKAGVRLAVSLNGSNDEVRSEVMPINKRYNIKELLEACRVHCRETKDKVTLEYVMLKDVTDSIEQARELHRLTRSVPCKINLIPFNEHPDSGYQRPLHESVVKFKNELFRLGSHVLVRKTMGRDIYAACGQLTSKFEQHPGQMNEDQLSVADYTHA